MALYLFINENQITREKKVIRAGGKVISTPTEATLRRLGYKELVEAKPSEEAPSGYHYVSRYEVRDNKIYETLHLEKDDENELI